jgi:hypothetical protein
MELYLLSSIRFYGGTILLLFHHSQFEMSILSRNHNDVGLCLGLKIRISSVKVTIFNIYIYMYIYINS